MNLTGQSNNLAQIQLAGREQSDVDKPQHQGSYLDLAVSLVTTCTASTANASDFRLTQQTAAITCQTYLAQILKVVLC